jgi:hypothetical protein
VLFESCGWAAWVPWASIEVEQPVKIVYRRRHHRLKYVTPLSKRCQELAHITFMQSIVSQKVTELCLEEASRYSAL